MFKEFDVKKTLLLLGVTAVVGFSLNYYASGQIETAMSSMPPVNEYSLDELAAVGAITSCKKSTIGEYKSGTAEIIADYDAAMKEAAETKKQRLAEILSEYNVDKVSTDALVKAGAAKVKAADTALVNKEYTLKVAAAKQVKGSRTAELKSAYITDLASCGTPLVCRAETLAIYNDEKKEYAEVEKTALADKAARLKALAADYVVEIANIGAMSTTTAGKNALKKIAADQKVFDTADINADYKAISLPNAAEKVLSTKQYTANTAVCNTTGVVVIPKKKVVTPVKPVTDPYYPVEKDYGDEVCSWSYGQGWRCGPINAEMKGAPIPELTRKRMFETRCYNYKDYSMFSSSVMPSREKYCE